MNDDVFVAKGYEHIWASSGHRLKWAFGGCRTDVELRVYVRMASYALEGKWLGAGFTVTLQFVLV